MHSGYLESIKQLREDLMLHEWELTNKQYAKRRSVPAACGVGTAAYGACVVRTVAQCL
jgi:hypothetical protein